jgi:C4-dicarboxylate-specific signal transduction histidine kinase/ABC-type nitrate/sulfonate/bicarbonate transport system substrate-binding protein
LKKVSLQLLWLDQFQFAGFYMAKERGFYKNVGLDLSFHPYKYGINIKSEVLKQKATFGVGRADIIRYDSLGKDFVLLAAIFQSTPSILLTLQSSNIKSIKDFAGKRIMQTDELIESASIEAVLNAYNVDFNSLIRLEHTGNLQDLIDKKVDIYSGYVSNEPYTLEKKGIKYKSFTSRDDGFDLYSDILFTSQEFLQKDPQAVAAFKRASLKGWEYAFGHIGESVDLIFKKYNSQNKTRAALRFEAEELKKLAYKGTSNIGKIEDDKVQRIYDIYKILGVATEPLNLKNLIYDSNRVYFTKKEQEYLQKRRYIKFCTQPDSLPYSAIENSHFIGIGANLLDLIEKNTQIKFKLYETKTWEESLEAIAKRECDFLPMAAETQARNSYVNFTQNYYYEPLVLVTREDKNYILDIGSVIHKEFSVVKGNSFIEYLKRKYPSLKLHEVDTIGEGLLGVEQGKYFAHIDIMMSAAYYIQHNAKQHLKINGQFNDSVSVCFAVRNDDPILFGIMNKLVGNIHVEELQNILNKWVSVNYTKGVNYKYIKEIVVLTLIFLLGLLYRGSLLKKQNSALEGLQGELIELNETLETRVEEAVYELEVAQEIGKIGSWIYDLEKNQLKWSKQCYTIFDIPKEKVNNLYESFQGRIHPDDLSMVEKNYEESLNHQKYYEVQHRLLMADDSIKYVYERGKTIFSHDGKALKTYGTVQDITEKVLNQEELNKKDAFLLHQSRLAQMGEMLSMIAHQWKQPLSAIASTEITLKTAVELEKYDLYDKTQQQEFLTFLLDRLDKIALYVQNLGKTIDNFSNYYKPNKASSLVSLDSIIQKSMELIQDSLKSALIEWEEDLNSKDKISAHENELMQVVLNILNNAKDQLINNNIENPKIILRSYTLQKSVVLEIEDNAGGVKEDILPKIFDPYFSTKREKNGTGLGLYMSKMIVEEYHDGHLMVENTKEGAKFMIKVNKEGIDEDAV